MRDKVHYPHHVEKYGPVEWVKFGIPVCFTSVAMGCCLLLLCNCKFSVKVQDVGQFGYVSYVDGNSNDNVCRPYSVESAYLYVDMDQQFRMAQVSAFMVIPMGFILIMTLLLAPFSRLMNGVWSRLLSVAGALVIGNLQLLSVVKFIRYFLRAYDGIHVRYESRFVVYGSVIFWLATAISVSICGVKQKVQYANREPTPVDEDNSPPWKVAEHDEDLNVTIEHDDEHDELEIVKSFSGGTRDTGDLEDGIAKSYESP